MLKNILYNTSENKLTDNKKIKQKCKVTEECLKTRECVKMADSTCKCKKKTVSCQWNTYLDIISR